MFGLFKKKENTEETEYTKILKRRIYRNKLKIRDHFALALIAFFFMLYVIIFKSKEDISLTITVIVIIIIISDFLMIAWHKHWIRKWTKELSDITGIDYTRIAEKDNLDKTTNDLTQKDYNGFLSTLKDEEKAVIRKAQNLKDGERLNLIDKTLLFTIDEKFRQYCENRGLVCFLKIKDIKVSTLPSGKKKTKKELKAEKKEKTKKLKTAVINSK